MKRMSNSHESGGYIVTSTPIQEQDDSGYNNSNKKRIVLYSSRKAITVSPISGHFASEKVHLAYLRAIQQNAAYTFEIRDTETIRKLQFDQFDTSDNECSTQSITDSGIESVSSLPHIQTFTKDFSEQNVDKGTNFLPSGVNSIHLSSTKNSNPIQSCNCNNHISNLSQDNIWHVEDHMACCQINSLHVTNEQKNICNTFTCNSEKLEDDICKHQNIDILSELNQINCSSVLSLLLSYLHGEDLRRVSYVSKDWREIVNQDRSACSRRNNYIKMKKEIIVGSNKENRYVSPVKRARYHKTAFHSIINIPEQPLYQMNSKANYESFLTEETNLLNTDILLKCPKCRSPSCIVAENRYCCTRNLCQYIFCKTCFGPYLDIHKCSVVGLVKIPNIVIGSKQSKRNLKRL